LEAEVHFRAVLQFLGAFHKIAKSGHWLLRVCLSVRMEELGQHWKDINPLTPERYLTRDFTGDFAS
jgi:hypothetical protein